MYSYFIPVMYYFMQKAECNAISLELYTPFGFQPIIYSVPLSIFNSNILNVGW